MNRIVQHIWQHIRCENTLRMEPVFDCQRPIQSTSDMRPWYTGRPYEPTQRSHINVCVFDSTWEAAEAFQLDHGDHPHVDSWVKNDHLGFEIQYVFKGVVKKFRPDFLIRLTNGTILVLEVKGRDTQKNRTNRQFLHHEPGQ